ncbi:MAG TPA: ribonuclease J [Candidatus Bathyarchaeia archaeon]|nr:ribonuclease J [Candidatus Bathyarchaeia archaeon]
MKDEQRKNESLEIVALGGWGRVNQNMFVYEGKKDILIVDCGVDFPDDPSSGVEVIVPDVSYLKTKRDKIRGVIITHGHLDHFGALPFILPQIGNPPVYATNLVKGFIQSRLAEFPGLTSRLHLIDPDKEPFRLGSFEITPFRVNHSVPDSLGLCLKTPVGKIFHVSDFKFDFTPVDNKVFQIKKAAQLASPEVLALVSDCLGAVTPGFTSSEKEIEKIFSQIISEAREQVFVTTVSSNISRLQQAIRVSLKHNRKIVILGRSIEEKIKVARKLGYLNLREEDVIFPQKANRLPRGRLTYLIAGSYGQPSSALARLASGDYKVRLKKGAVVIFSADPAPPGSKETVNALVDKLTLRGAKVYYYDIQENLHVSGHGSAGDIRLLFALVKPQYFIPIGGDPRHIRAYSFLAQETGVKDERILELFNGEVVQFYQKNAQVIKRLRVKSIPVRSK